MYQREVRPQFGLELAAQQLKQDRDKQTNRNSSQFAVSSPLSFVPNKKRILWGASALLTGCAITILQGCGGVTFHPTSAAAAVALSTLSCGTPSMTGAQSKSCTVSLTAAATSPTTVALTSSNPALSVPDNVVVATGATTAGFNAVSQAVSKSVSVTISGQAGSVTKTDMITLYPITASSAATPTLNTISCGTQSLTGAESKACTVSLTAEATSPTTVTLASSNAALSVPPTVVVSTGATTAGFNAISQAVSKSVSVTISGQEGGVSKTDVITLNPVSASATIPTLNTLSCGTQSLTGAESKACSVSLTAEATSPTTVTLKSSNPALSVPPTVVVAKGMTTAGFNAVSQSVSKSVSVTISGQEGGVSKTDVITLNPVSASAPTPILNTVSCGTQSLTGAQSKACTVSLTANATSPTTVTLTSSNSALSVPATVVVATGATTSGFNAVSKDVSKSVSVTISGQEGGVSKTDVITLYPAAAATPVLSKVSCGTQTLTGPTTEACLVYLSTSATNPTVIALSSSSTALKVPASVTVASGSTSAGFGATASTVAKTESVTLTATANGVSQTDVLQLEGTSSPQTPTQPSVKLSWDAPTSTSDPIAGYHVYRTAAGGSNYAMLSPSVDTQTTYTDSTVQSGNSYDYVVKSVDKNGVESAPSNTTGVTVP